MTTPSANAATLRRMRNSALSRIQDANTLRQSNPLGERSDSETLLELLALEILLKCLVLMNDTVPGRHGHHYNKLFDQLPEDVRGDLITRARTRIGPGSELDSDYRHVLRQLGRNFIVLRYAYEAYETLTETEVAEIGEDWIAIGAPLEFATFVHYPEEILGLLHALTEMTASLAD